MGVGVGVSVCVCSFSSDLTLFVIDTPVTQEPLKLSLFRSTGPVDSNIAITRYVQFSLCCPHSPVRAPIVTQLGP